MWHPCGGQRANLWNWFSSLVPSSEKQREREMSLDPVLGGALMQPMKWVQSLSYPYSKPLLSANDENKLDFTL